MAMTKKERAAFDAALKAAIRVGALRATAPVLPDLPIPAYNEPLVVGWTYNIYRGQALPACSSSVNHAVGRTNKTDTQGALALYSTRLLALKAMRHAMEQKFAYDLASVDEAIGAAEKEVP